MTKSSYQASPVARLMRPLHHQMMLFLLPKLVYKHLSWNNDSLSLSIIVSTDINLFTHKIPPFLYVLFELAFRNSMLLLALILPGGKKPLLLGLRQRIQINHFTKTRAITIFIIGK